MQTLTNLPDFSFWSMSFAHSWAALSDKILSSRTVLTFKSKRNCHIWDVLLTQKLSLASFSPLPICQTWGIEKSENQSVMKQNKFGEEAGFVRMVPAWCGGGVMPIAMQRILSVNSSGRKQHNLFRTKTRFIEEDTFKRVLCFTNLFEIL